MVLHCCKRPYLLERMASAVSVVESRVIFSGSSKAIENDVLEDLISHLASRFYDTLCSVMNDNMQVQQKIDPASPGQIFGTTQERQ